jgi:hypothetical protein
MTDFKAKAIKDHSYSPKRQPISGYILGYDVESTWRVCIYIGRGQFLSQSTYKSYEAASKAAKRINSKKEGEE